MLVGTMHGFADTVRFRGRGLIVDRAITTGHNRVIRGGAMFLNLIFACQFAHEMRTLPGTPKDMCTAKSLHTRSRQQYFMVASKRRTVRGLGWTLLLRV